MCQWPGLVVDTRYVYFHLIFILKVNMYWYEEPYWVIQNDCGQEWQLCTKIYVATVWVG
jgi:hypothetical protein